MDPLSSQSHLGVEHSDSLLLLSRGSKLVDYHILTPIKPGSLIYTTRSIKNLQQEASGPDSFKSSKERNNKKLKEFDFNGNS